MWAQCCNIVSPLTSLPPVLHRFRAFKQLKSLTLVQFAVFGPGCLFRFASNLLHLTLSAGKPWTIVLLIKNCAPILVELHLTNPALYLDNYVASVVKKYLVPVAPRLQALWLLLGRQGKFTFPQVVPSTAGAPVSSLSPSRGCYTALVGVLCDVKLLVLSLVALRDASAANGSLAVLWTIKFV